MSNRKDLASELAELERSLGGTSGRRVLAQSRRARGHARFSETDASRVPKPGRYLARFAQPPPLLVADGGVAGAGRIVRLLGQAGADGEDCSLCHAAARNRPGRAALLCDRPTAARRRRWSLGRKSHGTPDEDRGQPGSPGQRRRDEPLSPGVDPHAVRSRSLADRHLSRPHASLDGGGRRTPRGAGERA